MKVKKNVLYVIDNQYSNPLPILYSINWSMNNFLQMLDIVDKYNDNSEIMVRFWLYNKRFSLNSRELILIRNMIYRFGTTDYNKKLLYKILKNVWD